ncbi:hypothetical protein ACFL9U_14350 [Thermodesulfobacteriota bacterium]
MDRYLKRVEERTSAGTDQQQIDGKAATDNDKSSIKAIEPTPNSQFGAPK